MRIFILVILSQLLVFSVDAQKYDIKTLIDVYNSDSLNKALFKLKGIEGFIGSIVSNTPKKNIIKGKISNDKIVGTTLKNKTKLTITSYDKLVFDNLLKQARQEFHMQGRGPYGRGSKIELRSIYDFYLKENLLWFILTICRPTHGKAVYYEIVLKTYPED